MKLITLLASLFLVHPLVAQSTQTLDADNGFRSFTLGDSLSKYDGKLRQGKTVAKSGVTTYVYSGEEADQYSVFDLQMDSIKLYFQTATKILQGIELAKHYPASNKNHHAIALEDNKKIMKGFLRLFGNRIGQINRREPSEDLGVFWLGEKVTLSAYTSYRGRKGGTSNVVSFFNTSFYKK